MYGFVVILSLLMMVQCIRAYRETFYPFFFSIPYIFFSEDSALVARGCGGKKMLKTQVGVGDYLYNISKSVGIVDGGS